MKKSSNGLVGQYFVTSNEDGVLHNQGAITMRVDDGRYYMVSALSWLSGMPNGAVLVSGDQIHRHFLFTGDNADDHGEYIEHLNRTGKKVPRPAFDLFQQEEQV